MAAISLIKVELPADAQTSTFYCDTSGNVPVTRIRTGRGEESFIQWRNSFGQGYSATRRCQEVSARFERQHTRRKRLILTSRRNINGHPVICYTESKKGTCSPNNILVTLPQNTNHRDALIRFNAFRSGASNNPLELSGDGTDETLSGGNDDETITSLITRDSNWSQDESGELYYNLSAAVNSQGIAPNNSQNSDPVETTPTQPKTPSNSPSKLPPGWRF